MRDTIDMACEAGIRVAKLLRAYGNNVNALCDSEIDDLQELKAFEALVRADEREIVMNEPLTKAQWQRFEDEIRADEREACAKVADQISDKYGWGYSGNEVDTADEIANAIRARGNA
jgi:hypothetical protein